MTSPCCILIPSVASVASGMNASSARCVGLGCGGILVSMASFPASELDQRQDLGPEFLHAREDFVGCRAAESEINAADTDVAQRSDVGGDERRRTGKQAVFAITGLRWRALAEHRAAQAQADRLRIATRFGGHLAQARHLDLITRQAIERILRVGTDRIPRITDAGSTSQRRTALASDPDRRMRLLHGLRLETDIGETDMLTVELRRIPRPEFNEGAHIFVRHCSTRIEVRRVHGLELLAHPARTDTQRQPAT